MKRSQALLVPLMLLITAVPITGEVRTFSLASGEVLVHTFEGGVPLPSASKWAVCVGAGPALVPEEDGYRLNWIVHMEPNSKELDLERISRVVLQEVSGASVVELFTGKPSLKSSMLMVLAPDRLVSRETYPWLYDAHETLFVLRVELARDDEETDVLLQPVLLGLEVKRQLAQYLANGT